jgi:hypothetical protein
MDKEEYKVKEKNLLQMIKFVKEIEKEVKKDELSEKKN